MDAIKTKLNEEKTECLIIGKSNVIQRLAISELLINDTVIKPQNVIKDLGVYIDKHLLFKDQINHVVRVASYHLRNISFVKKYLDEKTVHMLIHNHVISRLDYCNSIYYGLPNYLLKKMQYVINRAARLIKGLPSHERITPVLIELHWLPIKARIIYKICTLTYQVLKCGEPKYLKDHLHDFYVDTSMVLRHNDDQNRLVEPRSNTNLGFRAFARCAPRLYNKLPICIKNCENLSTFKKKLKTHLFNDAYDVGDLSINPPYRV